MYYFSKLYWFFIGNQTQGHAQKGLSQMRFVYKLKTEYYYFKMEGNSFRKTPSQRIFEGLPIKRLKRVQHIKSLPAFQLDSVRRSSISKIQLRSKDEHQTKLKRFKTQQHLKPPHFGAVKTARDRNLQLARRKQQPSQPSKSFTKSTTYRSPVDSNEKRKAIKCSKSKSKKSLKKMYSSMLSRVKYVMQEYQLKLNRYKQQNQQILKQNSKLKSQLELMGRRAKKIDK